MANDVFLLADTLQVGTFVMLLIVRIKKGHLKSQTLSQPPIVQRPALHRQCDLLPFNMKYSIIQPQPSLQIPLPSKPIQLDRRRITFLVLHIGLNVHPVAPSWKVDFKGVALSCGKYSQR